MNLSNITPAEGHRKVSKRLGRGPGSGKGGTSTKGHKGHQSRASYKFKEGFEGGQMPLQRRVPKFGFKNPFRVEYSVINLSRLQEFAENNPELVSQPLDAARMQEYGLIGTLRRPVKILGRGELKTALTVHAHKFSESALKAIAAAGGSTVVIE